MPKSRYTEEKKPKPEPITMEGFQKYLNENGAEKAQGYVDAMILMTDNLEAMFYRYDPKLGFETTSSPNRVRTGLYNFVDEMQQILSRIKDANATSNQIQSNEIS